MNRAALPPALALSLLLAPLAGAAVGLEAILAPLPEPEPEPAPRAEAPAQSRETAPAAERAGEGGSASEAPAAEAAPARPEEPIRSEDLLARLEEALDERLRVGGQLELAPLRDLPDLSRHAQPFEVRLIDAPSRLSRSNVMLRFKVENEKGSLGEWSVPFRPRLLSEVWRIKAHLRKGDLASPSDLEVHVVDLLVHDDAVPATHESLMRHEYRRSLSPGRPLLWSDLVERSLVSKGELVEVVASKGLMAITMRAVARQDGLEDDIIVLRNLDSSREFSGRVVGKSRVEVTF